MQNDPADIEHPLHSWRKATTSLVGGAKNGRTPTMKVLPSRIANSIISYLTE